MNKLLLAIPALLTATPAFAQVMSPAEYVMSASAGDLYERIASQIVLQSTSDPRVREFATMMIEHHTKSSQDVAAAAGESGLKPMPPKLNPAQSEMIAQLKASSGTARDAAYIAQQKAAHGQALDLQKAYAMEGRSAPLRGAAGMIVPVVERHVQLLHAM